jgi:hypothetical protein
MNGFLLSYLVVAALTALGGGYTMYRQVTTDGSEAPHGILVAFSVLGGLVGGMCWPLMLISYLQHCYTGTYLFQ